MKLCGFEGGDNRLIFPGSTISARQPSGTSNSCQARSTSSGSVAAERGLVSITARLISLRHLLGQERGRAASRPPVVSENREAPTRQPGRRFGDGPLSRARPCPATASRARNACREGSVNTPSTPAAKNASYSAAKDP